MNPMICIKITPVQSASLQGQIIPPKMVSSLGTKSMSGEKAGNIYMMIGDRE